MSVSTHSRPKAAGLKFGALRGIFSKFQHTAARRRLDQCLTQLAWRQRCFNTQPPEGGWFFVFVLVAT